MCVQGQELTSDVDEKTLGEMQFKDTQVSVHVCVRYACRGVCDVCVQGRVCENCVLCVLLKCACGGECERYACRGMCERYACRGVCVRCACRGVCVRCACRGVCVRCACRGLCEKYACRGVCESGTRAGVYVLCVLWHM